jgi:hypothetical protein
MRFISFLLLLLAAAPVHAQPSGGPYGHRPGHADRKRSRHVAPDGQASARRPRATRDAGIRDCEVVSGDAIMRAEGVYRTTAWYSARGITMQPYANERPILKARR